VAALAATGGGPVSAQAASSSISGSSRVAAGAGGRNLMAA
jgi:hypothetical protein